jgi:hypothetical protein
VDAFPSGGMARGVGLGGWSREDGEWSCYHCGQK